MTDVTILYDRVLLKPVEAEKTSAGGILLAGQNNDNTVKGEVVKVGEGRKNKAGTVIPLEVKVGDIVLYDTSAVIPVKIDGQDLVVIPEDKIFLVFDN